MSAAFLSGVYEAGDRGRKLAAKLPWPTNVRMGVSVEDSRVFHRIDDLREVPAAIRFLSCEPLIGSLPESICGAKKEFGIHKTRKMA